MPARFLPLEGESIGLLLPLMARLYAHEVLPFNPDRARRAVGELLADPDSGEVRLIEFEGEPVGYFVLTAGYSLEFQGRFGLLDELYVDDAVRGRGIGAEALAYAEELCRTRGFHALRLEVDRRNARAQRLYRRRGFEAHDRDLMSKWL